MLVGKRSPARDSSDDEVVSKPSKKRRVLDSDDDQDSENTSNNKLNPKPEPKKIVKRSIAAENPPHELKTPKAKQAKVAPESAKGNKKKEDNVEDEPQVAEKDTLLMVDNMNKVWLHEELTFMQPNKIQDKNKRKPGDPEYDPRTLFVPQDFLDKQTPGTTLTIHSVTMF